MKLLPAMFLVLTSLVAQAVLADDTPSPQALGMMEAVLHVCAKVDSESTATAKKLTDAIKQIAPASVIGELRKSDDYRQAYESITDAVDKMDASDTRDACSQYLAQFKG